TFMGIQQPASPYPAVGAAQAAPTPVAGFQTAAPPVATVQTGASEGVTEVRTAYRPEAQLPAEKNQDKVGHEQDYSWITGQLTYVRADGGRWVLRYGHPEENDKYGGAVTLAPTVEMRNYRDGDLVCVFGQVIDEGRSSRSLSSPLYRVNSISMVERAD